MSDGGNSRTTLSVPGVARCSSSSSTSSRASATFTDVAVKGRRPRVLEKFADDVVEPARLLEHDLTEAIARLVEGAAARPALRRRPRARPAGCGSRARCWPPCARALARRSAARIRASIARMLDRSSQAAMRPMRRPSPARSAEKVMPDRDHFDRPAGAGPSPATTRPTPPSRSRPRWAPARRCRRTPSRAGRCLGGGHAGDVLGGPVDRGHAMLAVQRDESRCRPSGRSGR